MRERKAGPRKGRKKKNTRGGLTGEDPKLMQKGERGPRLKEE